MRKIMLIGSALLMSTGLAAAGQPDTCLNMLDECEFEAPPLTPELYPSVVDEAGKGKMDLSDLVLREHCRLRGYVLVSNDLDYRDCGLDLVTSNRKLLRSR